MGDPRRYILKVGTEDSLAQNFARNIRPFRREVAAYQLLRSCNHLAAPRCYLSSATPDGSSGILLLEEILNGQNFDQLRGLTWPQLTSTAQAVARVHARFWNSPSLRKAKGLPLHQYMHARQVGQHLPHFVRWQPSLDFANARSLLFTAIYGLTIFSLKKDRCASSTGASLWQETHFSTSPVLPEEALKNPSPFFNTLSFWVFGIGNLSVAGCGVTRFTMPGRITAMPPFLHSPYR